MTLKKSSYYQVGLGDKFLFRAKIIFSIVLVITLGLSGSAIYAGISNGQIEKNIIKPIKSFWEESTKVYPTPSLTPIENLKIKDTDSNSSSNSKSTIEINTNTNNNLPQSNTSTTNRTYTIPTSTPRPTLPPQKSWEDTVREMDERAAQKRAENDAWFNQKAAENQALYQQRTEAAQKSLEEWKKQNGF